MSSQARRDAIRDIAANPDRYTVIDPDRRAADEIFGEDLFTVSAMKEYLPESTYRKLRNTIRQRAPLDPEVAEDVAAAMKQWALKKGASHYTHWFQPLTGATAEKHDAFLEPARDGGVIMEFSGKNLVVGESDASSFPSGGLRSTFEARGYTAWDPTSPAFIKRTATGSTLCIPTAFCSYTGEALDKKTPLLRSIRALSIQLQRMFKFFGLQDAGTPVITLGAEQEYFLIDRRLYLCRPDLIQTGRTLYGAPPPKHQQLDDHYYGAITPRVLSFMDDVDRTLWKLGIPAKTRHKEAAPGQFEIAPVFEELNLASDHNMITMEVLREAADRHGFVCLTHEKPFEGVNGSGKHNNWSVGTDKFNLLSPGQDPVRNAMFLFFVTAVLQGIDEHGELLRMATASSGNSYRLGAHEAPPAIISVYLGEKLTGILHALKSGDDCPLPSASGSGIAVETLPPLPQDASDRNRTSPFAFTGNKFEFRSPGSSQSCSGPNIVLNTIVADALGQLLDEAEAIPAEQRMDGLRDVLRRSLNAHRRIIFNGDNYSAAWVREAQRRGLPILRTVPEALDTILKPENMAIFEKQKVFTEAELRSRHEVYLADYRTRTRIEAELALIMARTLINPAVEAHLASLNKVHAGLTACVELPFFEKTQKELGDLYLKLLAAEGELETAVQGADSELQREKQETVRVIVDVLEKRVGDDLWPLPKYRELLFVY